MAGNEVLELDGGRMKDELARISSKDSAGLPSVFNSLSEIAPSQFTMSV